MSFLAALLVGAAPSFADAPRFQHHAHDGDHEDGDHYRDTSARPTLATKKGIALQSRALLDKSGVTHLEVTTGQLDSSAAAPGNITEVEVHLVRPGGEEGQHQEEGQEWQKEFEHLRAGGSVNLPLSGLAHNNVLAVQVHVKMPKTRGEERGNGEFKLQDTVKYRPDLLVSKLDYPSMARPGTDVRFSATIGEAMGDVGAHGDCALVVDGKEVDSAKGIWVDAGGVVTCRLSYNFSVSGVHNVAVRIQGVSPTDYDDSNNLLSGQIQVQNPASMFYSASVSESTTVTETTTDSYASGLATIPSEHVHNTSTQVLQSRYFYGQIPAALKLPLNVSYADLSDGKALSSTAYANLAADSTKPSADPAYTTVDSIQRFDAASNGWMTASIYRNSSTGAGFTEVDWTWDAGDVTYHSDGYCKSAPGYRCSAGDYTVNTTSTTVIAPRLPLGASYAATVVADDGTPYTGQPSMAIATQTLPAAIQPMTCVRTMFAGPGFGKICTSSSSATTSKSGNVALVQ